MNESLRDQALRGKSLADAALIIDWHVHLGRWVASYLPASGERMLAHMDRVGVARICVNGIMYSDVRAGNDAVAAFARQHPDRVVPFASLNPYQGNMLDELKRCVYELGMRAVKVHEMVQGQHSPAVGGAAWGWDKVWEFCGSARVPVLAHGVVTDEDIRRYSGTVFVLAHGTGALERLARLRECANLYADTAWTQNRAWSLPALVEILGPDRVLWGTDAPLDDFAHRLGIVLDAGLSEETQRKILGLNAARLLDIPA